MFVAAAGDAIIVTTAVVVDDTAVPVFLQKNSGETRLTNNTKNVSFTKEAATITAITATRVTKQHHQLNDHQP